MASLLLVASFCFNVYLIIVLSKLFLYIEPNQFWSCFSIKSVSNGPNMARLDTNSDFLAELAGIVTSYSKLAPRDTSFCETLQGYLKFEVEFAGTEQNLTLFKESLRKKCVDYVFCITGFRTPCYTYHTKLSDEIYRVSICYAVNNEQVKKLTLQNIREQQLRREKILPPVLHDDSLEKELNELIS